MRTLRHATLVVSIALLTDPAAATEIYCDGHNANLKAVVEMTEVLFNRRESERALEYYAPEVLSHNPDSGGPATTVPITKMQQMWRNSKVAYPDRHLQNDVIVCNGDMVVVRTTITGTMKGSVGKMPATGKSFKTTGIDIYRFKGGKVVERWGLSDNLSQLRQLGLLEAFVGTEAAE